MTFDAIKNSPSLRLDRPIAMSSREIAQLTGKEHKNVLADIRKMLESLAIQPTEFSARYIDAKGEARDSYDLPKRECLILVSGYCAKLRARIIDRWLELEGSAPFIDPLQVLNNPAAMRQLLLNYSENVLALEAKVKEQNADAAALERIAKSNGSLCITDAAKSLQMRPKQLFDYLKGHNWIYRRPCSHHWVAYQPRIQSLDLEHKVTTVLRADGSEKTAEQVRLTPKGLAKLAKLIPPALKLVS